MKSFIILIAIVSAECTIPSNFKKCSRKDPNFDSCLLDAVQDGITKLTRPYKELNLPSLEPLKVESLSVRGGRGVINIDQTFKNCEFFGLTKTRFDKYKVDFVKKTGDTVATVPELTVKCEYEIDGRVLLLPIKGQGNSTITFKNFHLKYHTNYEYFMRGNKTYFKLVSNDLDTRPGEIYMHFDNLFNGNKELGDTMNRVLNENSKEIYEEIKPDYGELMSQIMKTLSNNVFGKVSQEELFE